MSPNEQEILKKIHEAEHYVLEKIEETERDAKFLIEDTEKYIASEIKKGEKDITDEISHAREGHYKAIEREASDIIEEAECAARNIRNTSKGKINKAVDSLLSYILPDITP